MARTQPQNEITPSDAGDNETGFSEEIINSGDPQTFADDRIQAYSQANRLLFENQKAAALAQKNKQQAPARSTKKIKILSPVGFRPSATITHIPPYRPHVGSTRVDRTVNTVVIHTFSWGVDIGDFRKSNVLEIADGGPQRWISANNDAFGHYPRRFRAGVNTLTSAGAFENGRKVSTHIIISQKGDVIMSTDLDTVAWANAPVNSKSIAIDLEPTFSTTKLGKGVTSNDILLEPFSEEQLDSFAVVLKKLETIYSLPQTFLSTLSAAQSGKGYTTHAVVSAARSNPHHDPLAPQLQSQESWEEHVFSRMRRLPDFDLRSDVWQDISPEDSIGSAAVAALAVDPGNGRGANAVLRAGTDSLAGFDRSYQMQALSRDRYFRAGGDNSVGALNRINEQQRFVIRQLLKAQAEASPGFEAGGEHLDLDFDQGLWGDGKVV